jgi:soluble lytic murein transglycosylase-like protein
MSKLFFWIFAALLTFSAAAQARDLPFDECFSKASHRFSVDKRILVAIAQTESNLNPFAAGPRNNNGTYDIGIMQINSGWLSTLMRLGISERDLQGACTNIHVGAWILAKNIGVHGRTWKAVGAYNATTPSKQVTYVNKVQRNYLLVGSLVDR